MKPQKQMSAEMELSWGGLNNAQLHLVNFKITEFGGHTAGQYVISFPKTGLAVDDTSDTQGTMLTVAKVTFQGPKGCFC